MKRIAIIPARGGSKRIPKKNIAEFHGKSMIGYPIENLLRSNLFQNVYVSTDDQEIADIAKTYGAIVPKLRDKDLATDFAPVLEVARSVLREYEIKGELFDCFTMIMPCSPLITIEDIVSANNLFESKGMDLPVLSVSKFPSPIEWAFRENKGVLELYEHANLLIRSQDLKEAYYDTGNFSVQSCKKILQSENQVSSSFIKYEIDRLRAIDVDEPEDLELLKKIYSLIYESK